MDRLKLALAPLALAGLLTGCGGGDGVEAQKAAMNDAWDDVTAAYEDSYCTVYSHEDEGWSLMQMEVGSDNIEISEEAFEEWLAETC